MNNIRAFTFCTLTFAAAMAVGCQDRKPSTGLTQTTAGPAADAEAKAVATLEAQQDSGHCRTVLQQLDQLPSVSNRPALAEAQRESLREYLRLSPSEVNEVTQTHFSQTDAHYLSECLLVRAAIRSLRLENRPPLEQARLSFEWVCRMVYVDDKVPWPANPWLTLHKGSGVAVSRGYAVLAAWQQLGLDGCLIGPPSLKDARSVTIPDQDSKTSPTYAPIRACGVRIDKQVYLFDPISGQPMAASDGKGILTLTDARANPAAVPGQKPGDEAKDWRPFLAPSQSALSGRMMWLQGLRPGNSGAVLFIDVLKQKAAFTEDLPGVPCEAWNPPDDTLTATRILTRYVNEETSSRERFALRDIHRFSIIPLQHLPRTKLDASSLEYLLNAFVQPFGTLRYLPDSPREMMLRGQFQQATSSLEDTKQMADNARTRMERDQTLQKDFERWSQTFHDLFTNLNAARLGDPAMIPLATKALDDFRSQPGNRDIERAFILGNASRPLAADVTYLMAQCVHERAERTQLDSPEQAKANWENAIEWWNRFLDASAEARSPFPAREMHGRTLLARCRLFVAK